MHQFSAPVANNVEKSPHALQKRLQERRRCVRTVGNPMAKTTSPSFNCRLALPTPPPQIKVITGSELLKGIVCITDGVGKLFFTVWLLVGFKIWGWNSSRCVDSFGDSPHRR